MKLQLTVLMTLAVCLREDSAIPRPAPAGAMACTELAAADPWEDRLRAHGLADRGRLLSCTHAAAFGRALVASSPLAFPILGPVTHGYELLVLQFVSEGRSGEAQAVTALAYLPTGDTTGLPIVALDHGMFGVGPACGPSHAPIEVDAIAVPLAARGYPVVATDYAGVGVDSGPSSCLVGAQEAASTVDAVRAFEQLRELRSGTAPVIPEFFVLGYSQGGHAALFTHQAYHRGLTPGLRLLGSIAIAPGLGSAKAWTENFDDPERPVGLLETDAVASLYAQAQFWGWPQPSAWLSPAAQQALPTLLHDDCLPELALALATRFPTLGDLYQPAFLAAARRCRLQGECSEFEPWASRLAAEEPGRFASTVPTLLLQGLADPLVRPGTTSCIVQRLSARGTPVQACAYQGADHLSVIPFALPDILRWMVARRAGRTAAVCDAPLVAPCEGQ